MEIVTLLIFVSLVLVACGLGFFAWTLRQRTFEHCERLSLLPVEDEADLPPRRR